MSRFRFFTVCSAWHFAVTLVLTIQSARAFDLTGKGFALVLVWSNLGIVSPLLTIGPHALWQIQFVVPAFVWSAVVVAAMFSHPIAPSGVTKATTVLGFMGWFLFGVVGAYAYLE